MCKDVFWVFFLCICLKINMFVLMVILIVRMMFVILVSDICAVSMDIIVRISRMFRINVMLVIKLVCM